MLLVPQLLLLLLLLLLAPELPLALLPCALPGPVMRLVNVG
jgi:hypothetical protein